MTSPASRRETVTSASMPLLARISRLPRLTVPAVAAALVLLGLFLDGWAGLVPLTVLTVGLTWLTYLAWPRLSGLDRALRVVVTLLVLSSAVQRLLG